ncbi:C40 family peptidase [Pseudomonas putida]|uniref:C40 family peptidase n=1 Tax=Pseudomonas putida TaxID=303 RepID=UPI00300EF55E
MYLPVAFFSIVVLGSIAIDSKADEWRPPAWLQSGSEALNTRDLYDALPLAAKKSADKAIGRSSAGLAGAAIPASRQRIIDRAYELLGIPYKWGGMSLRNGFDCSGLLVYLFSSEVGLELPRTTKRMVNEDYPHVSRHELQPGDAIFFAHERKQVSHVGLYVGNDQFIHAPRTGKFIRVDSLKNNYWSGRYYGARRFE